MVSNIILSGLIMLGNPVVEMPNIWEKIEGKWSYVGEVKEKTQILVWIEKKTKTPNTKIFNKEIKKMPFITLSPTGEVLNLKPLQ